jgi:hypothetical protein
VTLRQSVAQHESLNRHALFRAMASEGFFGLLSWACFLYHKHKRDLGLYLSEKKSQEEFLDFFRAPPRADQGLQPDSLSRILGKRGEMRCGQDGPASTAP